MLDRDREALAGRKLSDAQVLEIRHAYSAGESQSSLADRFGVLTPAVSGIVTGRRFRKLGGPTAAPWQFGKNHIRNPNGASLK